MKQFFELYFTLLSNDICTVNERQKCTVKPVTGDHWLGRPLVMCDRNFRHGQSILLFTTAVSDHLPNATTTAHFEKKFQNLATTFDPKTNKMAAIKLTFHTRPVVFFTFYPNISLLNAKLWKQILTPPSLLCYPQIVIKYVWKAIFSRLVEASSHFVVIRDLCNGGQVSNHVVI